MSYEKFHRRETMSKSEKNITTTSNQDWYCCGCTRRSETLARDLRLDLIRCSTKQQVSSSVLPSGTSTTNDSTTVVPGLPSIPSWCNVITDAQFCTNITRAIDKLSKRDGTYRCKEDFGMIFGGKVLSSNILNFYDIALKKLEKKDQFLYLRGEIKV